MPRTTAIASISVALLVLGGCTGMPAASPSRAPAEAPAQWHAPLPYTGQPSELLSDLLDAAQAVSPTLASARSRIEAARAARVAAGAALAPKIDAAGSASRGQPVLGTPLATSLTATLQAAWEIDLFGAQRAARDAAQARLDGAMATWHEARVSLAAEVATSYTQLRACEAQLIQTQLDAASRAKTARLTDLSMRAGFHTRASAALARASAAQSNATLTQQRAACDLLVKAVVALTGTDEALLRRRLAAGTARVPQPVSIAVASVPAQALAQRPDLHSAARELIAASADVSLAQAQRLPRISLSGSIGTLRRGGHAVQRQAARRGARGRGSAGRVAKHCGAQRRREDRGRRLRGFVPRDRGALQGRPHQPVRAGRRTSHGSRRADCAHRPTARTHHRLDRAVSGPRRRRVYLRYTTQRRRLRCGYATRQRASGAEPPMNRATAREPVAARTIAA
jgi:outer membrane protein TolC